MERDPIRNDARKARRSHQFSTDAECAVCGERDPRACVLRQVPVICYECLAAERGRSRTEKHHFPNRDNSLFMIMLPGNDHRILNEGQRDWPTETFRNPHGSPLLKAAGALRGWRNVMQIIIERGVGWIPNFLEDLDAWLVERLGPEWWRQMPRR